METTTTVAEVEVEKEFKTGIEWLDELIAHLKFVFTKLLLKLGIKIAF